MEQTFLGWLVPFLCGTLLSAAATAFSLVFAVRSGLRCLLRAEIIRSHEKYTARGFCPLYAKEALKRAYRSYHLLGGNDVATELYRAVLTLPHAKKESEEP